ncbi:MAG: transcriptional repressor [Acidobacteriia bacterium]|nr:transcriptional repressor [Terriglobia bacterium]
MTVEIERRFEAYLRSVRMKRSTHRTTVLRVFMGSTKPMTSLELLYAVKQADVGVSLGVVYSTIKLMIACGLAREIVDGRKTLYTHEGVAACSHPHLICRDCGAVVARAEGPGGLFQNPH